MNAPNVVVYATAMAFYRVKIQGDAGFRTTRTLHALSKTQAGDTAVALELDAWRQKFAARAEAGEVPALSVDSIERVGLFHWLFAQRNPRASI